MVLGRVPVPAPVRTVAPVETSLPRSPMADNTLLVVSAHAGDFVWRAGGAIAAATLRGERAVVDLIVVKL